MVRESRPFSHLKHSNNYCILLCAMYKSREGKHSKNYCILLCAPSNKTQTKLNYKGIKTTATSSAVILRWAKWVWPLGVRVWRGNRQTVEPFINVKPKQRYAKSERSLTKHSRNRNSRTKPTQKRNSNRRRASTRQEKKAGKGREGTACGNTAIKANKRRKLW